MEDQEIHLKLSDLRKYTAIKREEVKYLENNPIWYAGYISALMDLEAGRMRIDGHFISGMRLLK